MVCVKLCFCVGLSGVGENSYILLSGKDTSSNIIFFLHFMVEDNYHQWEVKSNYKLH